MKERIVEFPRVDAFSLVPHTEGGHVVRPAGAISEFIEFIGSLILFKDFCLRCSSDAILLYNISPKILVGCHGQEPTYVADAIDVTILGQFLDLLAVS